MPTNKRHTPTRKPAFPAWAGWLIALLALGAVAAFAFLSRPAPVAVALPPEVSVQQARELVNEGAFLLDVRTPLEWDEAHVAGATLIPLDQLETRLSELPRDRKIVVMCRSGNRSATARDLLKQAGFEQVTSMAGGINQWRAAGFPVE
jgi:rhodanese-related sulfurtransferase